MLIKGKLIRLLILNDFSINFAPYFKMISNEEFAPATFCNVAGLVGCKHCNNSGFYFVNNIE